MSADAQAREELMRLGASGVPAILVDRELVVGFDRDRLRALLHDAIVACEHCGAQLRLPAAKGTLRVTCPKCGGRFTCRT